MKFIAGSLIILFILSSFTFATPTKQEYLEYMKSKESIWKGPADKRAVALTFDDGPKLEYCERLLDILDEYGVKATFFVVGRQAEIYPDLILRMHRSGHEVANHSYTQRSVKGIPKAEALSDIQRCSSIIYKITGVQPKYFRPPGGGYNDSLSFGIRKMGLQKVFWSLNPADYVKIDSVLENAEEYKIIAEELAEQVISKASNGDIILLHNGSEQTLIALPVIIEEVRKKGFGFVTLSQLLDEKI